MIKIERSLEKYLNMTIQHRWFSINKDYLDALNATLHRDRDFPEKVIPYILNIVKTEDEANMALDIIFSKITVMKHSERIGDHHAIDYGEETIGVYVNTENALILAKDNDMFIKLIQEKKKLNSFSLNN